MLLNLKLVIEKDQTDKKQVDRKLHRGMCFDFSPGLFHLRAPVNVIKNNHAGCVQVWKYLVEVAYRRFVPVIAIDKNQIEWRKRVEHIRQRIIKIAHHLLNGRQLQGL